MLLLCGCILTAVAQPPVPITEKIEWTWTDRPEAPVAGRPNVLLVGDSITRAYYPAVANDLRGVANVYLFASSACSGDWCQGPAHHCAVGVGHIAATLEKTAALMELGFCQIC